MNSFADVSLEVIPQGEAATNSCCAKWLFYTCLRNFKKYHWEIY